MKAFPRSIRATLQPEEPMNRHLYLLLSHLKRFIMAFNCLSLECRLYRSAGSEGRTASSMAYIGNLENTAWLERSLFQNYQLNQVRKIPFWQCRREIRRYVEEKVVTVVDINRIPARFLPPGGFPSYPWIRQVVTLDSREYRGRQRPTMSEFRRLMRKYSYTVGITSEAEDIRFFYDKLYLPFVEYRFESMAHPRSFPEISKAVRKGFILQIFHKNQWIAGDIIRVGSDEIQGIASGLLPDYNKASRRTARTVMYPVLFEWATSKGYGRINLLRSRANLEDGVFASKKHRGAIAEVDSWPHTEIRFYIPAGTDLPELWKTQLVEEEGKLVPLGEVL